MSTLQPCTAPDYRHEFWCEHRDRPRRRWRTLDGCGGSCCEKCWAREDSPRTWDDLSSVVAIDADGIPLDARNWTEGDQLGVVLRALIGRPLRALIGRPEREEGGTDG